MSERFFRISRRKFLASTAALALTGSGNAENPPLPFVRPPHPDTKDRKPLAVPKHYVHSLYVDQKPDNDLSREVARDYKVQLARSVTDALTQGGNKLVV